MTDLKLSLFRRERLKNRIVTIVLLSTLFLSDTSAATDFNDQENMEETQVHLRANKSGGEWTENNLKKMSKKEIKIFFKQEKQKYSELSAKIYTGFSLSYFPQNTLFGGDQVKDGLSKLSQITTKSLSKLRGEESIYAFRKLQIPYIIKKYNKHKVNTCIALTRYATSFNQLKSYGSLLGKTGLVELGAGAAITISSTLQLFWQAPELLWRSSTLSQEEYESRLKSTLWSGLAIGGGLTLMLDGVKNMAIASFNYPTTKYEQVSLLINNLKQELDLVSFRDPRVSAEMIYFRNCPENIWDQIHLEIFGRAPEKKG